MMKINKWMFSTNHKDIGTLYYNLLMNFSIYMISLEIYVSFMVTFNNCMSNYIVGELKDLFMMFNLFVSLIYIKWALSFLLHIYWTFLKNWVNLNFLCCFVKYNQISFMLCAIPPFSMNLMAGSYYNSLDDGSAMIVLEPCQRILLSSVSVDVNTLIDIIYATMGDVPVGNLLLIKDQIHQNNYFIEQSLISLRKFLDSSHYLRDQYISQENDLGVSKDLLLNMLSAQINVAESLYMDLLCEYYTNIYIESNLNGVLSLDGANTPNIHTSGPMRSLMMNALNLEEFDRSGINNLIVLKGVNTEFIIEKGHYHYHARTPIPSVPAHLQFNRDLGVNSNSSISNYNPPF